MDDFLESYRDNVMIKLWYNQSEDIFSVNFRYKFIHFENMDSSYLTEKLIYPWYWKDS